MPNFGHRNFLGATPPTATTYTHDDLNRAVSVTYSDGSADQTTYNGLMVTRANAKSQTITDHDGNRMSASVHTDANRSYRALSCRSTPNQPSARIP